MNCLGASSVAVIFTSYSNETNFSSKGYVYLLGWILTCVATGYDVAAHLAEEAQYPTKTVPKAVFWSTFISYLTGWALMLSLMAVLPSNPSSLTPPRDYSAPAQALTAVLPRGLSGVLLAMTLVTMQFQDVAQLLASSRFVWALARDSALPTSPYFRRLSFNSRIPVRAALGICCIVGPSMLLLAASRSIVTSLMLQGCGATLLLAYYCPVLCYLFCPKGALDVDGRNEWTLRSWSKPFAYAASAYVGLIVVMMCCPNGWPVNASELRTTPSHAIPQWWSRRRLQLRVF